MRSRLRTALKSIRASLDAKDLSGAKAALQTTVSIVDKMATSLIHRTRRPLQSRLVASAVQSVGLIEPAKPAPTAPTVRRGRL